MKKAMIYSGWGFAGFVLSAVVWGLAIYSDMSYKAPSRGLASTGAYAEAQAIIYSGNECSPETAVAVRAAVGVNVPDYSGKIRTLENSVYRLRRDLTSLTERVRVLEANPSGATSGPSVTELNVQIQNMQVQIGTAQTDQAEFRRKLEEVTQTQTRLQSVVTTLEGTMVQTREEITRLTTQGNANSVEIARLTERAEQAQRERDELKVLIERYAAQIGEIQRTVENNNIAITQVQTQLEQRIVALEQRSQEQGQQLQTQGSQLQAQNVRIEENTTRISEQQRLLLQEQEIRCTLQRRNDELTTQVNSLSDLVSKLDKAIEFGPKQQPSTQVDMSSLMNYMMMSMMMNNMMNPMSSGMMQNSFMNMLPYYMQNPFVMMNQQMFQSQNPFLSNMNQWSFGHQNPFNSPVYNFNNYGEYYGDSQYGLPTNNFGFNNSNNNDQMPNMFPNYSRNIVSDGGFFTFTNG